MKNYTQTAHPERVEGLERFRNKSTIALLFLIFNSSFLFSGDYFILRLEGEDAAHTKELNEKVAIVFKMDEQTSKDYFAIFATIDGYNNRANLNYWEGQKINDYLKNPNEKLFFGQDIKICKNHLTIAEANIDMLLFLGNIDGFRYWPMISVENGKKFIIKFSKSPVVKDNPPVTISTEDLK